MSIDMAKVIVTGVTNIASIAAVVALVITGHPWWAIIPSLAIVTYTAKGKS